MSDQRADDVKLGLNLLWSGRLPTLARWRLAERLRGARPVERVVLAYDLASQPVSVGDVLVFAEGGLVLREQLRAHSIEFVLLADAHERHSDPAFAHLQAANLRAFARTMANALEGLEHITRVHVFDDHGTGERFLAQAARDAQVWPGARAWAGTPEPGRSLTDFATPSGGARARQKYLYYPLFNDVCLDFFRRNGRLPGLRCRQELREEASRFIASTGARIPVTVQLRFNSDVAPERNSNFDGWRRFFAWARAAHPAVGFILIGSAEEEARFGAAPPNVFVAKRSGSSLALDLALIGGAAAHMGVGSGPAAMAVFNQRPYCLWSPTIKMNEYVGSRCSGDIAHHAHASDDQLLILGTDSDESILLHGGALLAALHR